MRDAYDWVPLEDAEFVVALGGDGFMLQTLHADARARRSVPVFGMNLGTVGFLMNEWRPDGLDDGSRGQAFKVSPLRMTAITVDGETRVLPAINEVSLLRETRQTAKLRGDRQRPYRPARAGLRRHPGGDPGRFDRV